MTEISELYNDVIRRHAAHPVRFDKNADEHPTVVAHNPVCGDRFSFTIETQGGTIQNICFYGFGCAVSKASASMLTEHLTGLKHTAAIAYCKAFVAYIDGNSEQIELLPKTLESFRPVHRFPERRDCAVMVWEKVGLYLEKVV